MRIQRHRSRLSFRSRRRRSGCLPSVILLGILVGAGALSWNWIQAHLLTAAEPIGVSSDDGYAAAVQAFNQGNLDNAVALARQALTVQPDRPDAIVLLARALVYRSYNDYNRAVDRQSALELTTRATTRSPNNMSLLAAHAFVLQSVGNAAASFEAAERVLTKQPSNALARTALALAYGGAGSFESALRESQRAIQGDGWQLDAFRALAITYSDLGDYSNALRNIARAIELNPKLTPLYFEQALYALQIGDADSATHAYYQVLTFDPENVKVRLRLCDLSSTMRERDSAIRYCSEVTERAPAWADGWYTLGHEYFLQGNFTAARDDLHRCSTLQVMQNVPVKDRRFECWYLQGQAAEILGDCPSLLATYNEFRSMVADTDVQQTWTYPPEGPPGCIAAPAAS